MSEKQKVGEQIEIEYTSKASPADNQKGYRCSKCTRLVFVKEKYCPECGEKKKK